MIIYNNKELAFLYQSVSCSFLQQIAINFFKIIIINITFYQNHLKCTLFFISYIFYSIDPLVSPTKIFVRDSLVSLTEISIGDPLMSLTDTNSVNE